MTRWAELKSMEALRSKLRRMKGKLMAEWHVVAEPVGDNPRAKADIKSGRKRKTAGSKEEKKEDNVGGVVVYVQRGSQKEEVARVAFVRETSENPKVGFEDKLNEILDVAETTAQTLNDLTPDGALQ